MADFEASSGSDISPLDAPLSVPNPRPPPKQQQQQQQQGSVNQKAAPPITLSQLTGGKASSDSSAGSPNANASNVNAQRQGQIASPAVNLGGGGGVNAAAAAASSSADSVLAAASDPKANPALAAALAAANRRMPIKSNLGLGSSSSSPAPSPTPASSMSLSPTLAVSGGVSSVVPAAVSAPPMVAAPSLSAPPPPSAATPETLSRAQIASKPPTASTVSLSGAPPLNLGGGIAASSADSVLAAASDPKANPALAAALAAANRRMPIKSNLGLGSPPTPAPSSALTSPASPLTYAAAQAANNTSNHSAGEQQRQQTQPTPAAAAAAKENKTVEDSRSSSPAAGIHHVSSAMPSASRENAQNNSVTTKKDNDREGDREAEERREADRLSLFEKDLAAGSRITPAKEIARGDDAALYRHGIRESKPPMEVARRDGVSSSSPTRGGGGGVSKKNSTTNDDEAMAPNHNYDGTYYNVNPRGDLRNRFEEQVRQREAFLAKKAEMEEKLLAEKLARRRRNYDPNRFYNVECRPTSPSSPPPPPRSTPQQKFEAELAAFKKRRDMADEAKEMARLQKIEERLRRRRKSGTSSSSSALLIGGGGAGASGDTSTCIVDQQGRNKSSNRRGGEVSGGTSSSRRSKFLVTASLADPDSVPYDLFRFGTKNGISSNHSHHTDATTIGASDMSIRRANVSSLVRTGRLATSKKGASLSQIAGGVGAGSGDDGVGIAPPTNISYATFTKVASVGKTHLGQGGALSPSTSAPAVLFGGFFKLEPTEAEAREEIEQKRQAAQPSFITNAATQNEYANLTEEQNRKRVDRALEKKRREKEKELLRRRRDEERESAHRRRFERKKKRMAQRMSERSYVVQNPDGSVSAHIEAAPLPVKVLRSGSTRGMSDDEEDIDGSGSDHSSRSFSSNRGNSDAASSTSTSSSSSSSSDGYGSSSSSSSFSEKKADKKEKRAQKKAAFNELPVRHQLARVGCFSDGFYCFDEESKGWTRLNERIRVEPTTRRSTVIGHAATTTNSSSIGASSETGRGLRKSSFPAPRGHHAAAFAQIDNTLYFHGGVGGPAPQALSNRNLENYLKLRERALALMSSSGKTTRRGGGVNEDGNKFTSKFAVSVDLYDENTVADVISPPADLEEALDRMGHLCDLWGLNMEKLVLKRIPYGFDEASLEWALRRREEEDREEEAAGSRRHKPDDKNNNGNSGSPLAQRRAQTDKIFADIAAERHLLLKRSHRSGHVGVVLPSSGGFVVIGGQYAHATKAKISRKRDAKLFSSSVSKNTTLQSPSNAHQQQPSGFAVEDDSETTENSDSGSGASSVSSVTARRRERRRQERAIREESKKQQEHQQQQQEGQSSGGQYGHPIVGGNYNAAGEHRRYSAEDDVAEDGPNEADDDDTSPADRSKWRVEYGLCSLRTLDVFNVNSRPLQPPPPPSRGKESSAAVHNADDVCSWRLLPTTGAVPCPRMYHAVVVAPVCETITTVFRDAPKSEEELLEEHAEHQSPNHRANYQNGSQAGMGSGSDNSFFLPPPLTRSIEAGAAMYLFGGQTTAEHYMRHEASMSTQHNNNNYNAGGSYPFSPHRGPHHYWDQNHNTGGYTGSSAVSSPPSCATDITSRLLFPLEDLYQLNLATFVWSKVDLQPSLLFGGGLRTPFPSSSSAAFPAAGGNFLGANSVFKMVPNNTNSASGARTITSCSNDTRSATAPFVLKLNANRRVLLNPHLSVVEVPSLCQNNTGASSPLFDAPHQSRDDEEATTVASPMNHNEGINLLMMPAPTSANRMFNQHESSSSDAKGGLFVVKDTVPRGLETQQQLQQHKQQGSAAGVGVPFSHPYGTQKSFTVALGVEGFGALQLLSGPPEHHQQSIALTQQQQQQQHMQTNTNVASFTGSPLLARPQQSIVVTSAATSRDLRVQQVKHYHQPAPAKIYALVLTGLITTAGATTTAHCLYKIENGPFESLRHQRARRREERKLWAREKEAERRKEKGEGIHGRGRGGLGRQYNDGDNEETSHSYYDSPPRPNHGTNDACVEPSGLVNDSTSAVTLAKEQQGASSPRRKGQRKTNAAQNQKIKRSASSSGSHGYAEDNSDSRKTGTSSSEDNTERRENATTDRSKAVTFGNSDKAVGAPSPQRTADDGRPPADRKIVDGEKVVRKLLEMARNGQKRGKDGEGQPADVYITIRDEDKALRDEQRRKGQKYGGAPSFLSYRSTPSDVKKRKEEVRRRKESNGGNSSTAGLAMSAGGGGGTRRNKMVRPNSSSFKASQTVSYVSASTPLALRGGVPHARNRSASPLAGRLSTRRKHSKSSSYSVSTGLHKSHHAVDWVAWLHGETTKKGQSVPEGVQVSLEMVSLVPMRALGLSFTSAVGALGACSPFADEVMGFSQSHDENGSSPTTNSMRGRKDGSSGGGGGGPSPHLLHQSAAIAPKFANFSLALTGIELDVRRGPFDPSVRMSNKRSIALTSTHPPTHITEGGGGGAAPACCEFMGPLFMSEAYIGRRLREAERREAQRRFEAEVAASSTSPAPTASPQPADSRSTNKDRKEIGNKKLRGSKKSRGSSAGSSSANYGEDFEKKSSSTRSYSNSFSSSRSRTPSNYSSGYSSRSSSSPRRKQKKKMNAKQHQKEREDEKRTPAKRKESPPTKQNPPQNVASPTSPHKHHQRQQQAPPPQHSTTDRKAGTLPLAFEEMPPSSPSWWQASQPYNALMAHYQHHFSRALPTYVAEQHAALQAADIEERAILVHQSKQGAQPYVSASYRDQTQHSSPRAAPNGHVYDPNQPQPSAYYSPHNPHGHHRNPTTSATYPPTHQSQPHPLYYANEYPSDYNNNSSAATRGLLPPNYNMYNAPPAHTSPPHDYYNYDNNNPQHNLYHQQQQQQYYPHPHPQHPMPMSSAAGPYVNNYNNNYYNNNYMYYNDGTSNPKFLVGASANYPAHWRDSNPHQLYQQHQHQQHQPLPYPQQRNHQSAYSVNSAYSQQPKPHPQPIVIEDPDEEKAEGRGTTRGGRRGIILDPCHPLVALHFHLAYSYAWKPIPVAGNAGLVLSLQDKKKLHRYKKLFLDAAAVIASGETSAGGGGGGANTAIGSRSGILGTKGSSSSSLLLRVGSESSVVVNRPQSSAANTNTVVEASAGKATSKSAALAAAAAALPSGCSGKGYNAYYSEYYFRAQRAAQMRALGKLRGLLPVWDGFAFVEGGPLVRIHEARLSVRQWPQHLEEHQHRHDPPKWTFVLVGGSAAADVAKSCAYSNKLKSKQIGERLKASCPAHKRPSDLKHHRLLVQTLREAGAGGGCWPDSLDLLVPAKTTNDGKRKKNGSSSRGGAAAGIFVQHPPALLLFLKRNPALYPVAMSAGQVLTSEKAAADRRREQLITRLIGRGREQALGVEGSQFYPNHTVVVVGDSGSGVVMPMPPPSVYGGSSRRGNKDGKGEEKGGHINVSGLWRTSASAVVPSNALPCPPAVSLLGAHPPSAQQMKTSTTGNLSNGMYSPPAAATTAVSYEEEYEVDESRPNPSGFRRNRFSAPIDRFVRPSTAPGAAREYLAQRQQHETLQMGGNSASPPPKPKSGFEITKMVDRLNRQPQRRGADEEAAKDPKNKKQKRSASALDIEKQVNRLYTQDVAVRARHQAERERAKNKEIETMIHRTAKPYAEVYGGESKEEAPWHPNSLHKYYPEQQQQQQPSVTATTTYTYGSESSPHQSSSTLKDSTNGRGYQAVQFAPL